MLNYIPPTHKNKAKQKKNNNDNNITNKQTVSIAGTHITKLCQFTQDMLVHSLNQNINAFLNFLLEHHINASLNTLSLHLRAGHYN